ncbi:MAG: AsmA-like C-terminal region-containing protein, partial [Flavobacteriaceae bacterium]|nr:AsmA-like C-terminal region-containing protein [Flavobacteriaceae bacterium]
MKIKKALKIFAIILGVLLIVLISIPYFFKAQIEDAVKKSLNESLNAKVDFQAVDLSLIKSFPKLNLAIEELSVINVAPFEGDTLFYAKETRLKLPIKSLFNTSDMQVNEVQISNAVININVNGEGEANYNIAKKSDETATATDSETASEEAFQLQLESYTINNTNINYRDDSADYFLELKNLTHSGSGDFSAKSSVLKTQTDAYVTYIMSDIAYLKNQHIKLDAEILMDLEQMRFSFQENEALLNELPLNFEGFVQLNEDNTEIDLSFKTPSSSFENFFQLIPEAYKSNMSDVTTTGNFDVSGTISGKVDETYIPELDIKIASENASFKFADLPQKVSDITMRVFIKNETGIADETYIDIPTFNFSIDNERIASALKITKLTTNPYIQGNASGKLDLNKLAQAYPMPDNTQLSGKLDIDLTTAFDMQSIEQSRYANIKSQGTAQLSDFTYNSKDLVAPVNIQTADLNFTSNTVKLNQFNATVKSSDLNATGTIDNFMGFLLKDQELKGNFVVNSKKLNLNELKATAETTTKNSGESEPSSTDEAIKIPKMFNIRTAFKVDELIYDNLSLKNLSGSALIKDESIALQQVTSDLFGGNIAFDGLVSTANDQPVFDMGLQLNQLAISQSVSQLGLLANLAPILSSLDGLLNSTLNLKGKLTPDLTPIYSSLAGYALATIVQAKINPENNNLVSNLNTRLPNLNLQNLNIQDLSTKLNFNDGAVNVAPLQFKVEDIGINLSGSHSFDQNLNYAVTLNLPAKYLGDEAADLVAKLSPEKQETTMVNLPLNLSGSIKNPQIQLDMKSAIAELSKQLINDQKDKL